MHCGHYYLNCSPALCSFIYVDVGEPTSHPCSMTEMIQDHHLSAPQDFESLGTSLCGNCYDKGDPFHLQQRPHGVLEVSWRALILDHCDCPSQVDQRKCVWTNASQCCAMWCDDNRLREELVECHIGSFVQVHIETLFSDLVRIDLQAALQRSIDTLHLPVKC